MRSFEVQGETVTDFVSRVDRAIAERGFADIVAVRVDQDRLVVRFSWLGRSRLSYRLVDTVGGFRALVEEQRMSPVHGPFRAAFEDRFESVIAELGAVPLED